MIPYYISFSDGVVRPAVNQGEWADPMIQLRDRVLNYGHAANLLDENFNIIHSMTLVEAGRLQKT